MEDFVIEKEDVDFKVLPPEGYELVQSELGNIFLNKEMNEELKKEAYTREIVRRIQQMRKEMDLNIEENIVTYLVCDFDLDEEYIKKETRSDTLRFEKGEGYHRQWTIDSEPVEIWIEA